MPITRKACLISSEMLLRPLSGNKGNARHDTTNVVTMIPHAKPAMMQRSAGVQ